MLYIMSMWHYNNSNIFSNLHCILSISKPAAANTSTPQVFLKGESMEDCSAYSLGIIMIYCLQVYCICVMAVATGYCNGCRYR